MNIKVADVVKILNDFYPPQIAQDWDRVGLIAGDPQQEVKLIGFAVDPCAATIAEAISREAQILITHHPLYLRGTSSVAATNAKGAWIHQLIKHDCALFAAHTNADAAVGGSADALAELLQLKNTSPLLPNKNNPEIGIGKVGELPLSMSVRELAYRLKALLPAVPAGITIGGDSEKIVRKVALSPGAGDSLLTEVAQSEADVYITADLRHHPATDHLWNNGCALIGLSHFASEWPLLPKMRKIITEKLSVATYISTINTDPWEERI